MPREMPRFVSGCLDLGLLRKAIQVGSRESCNPPPEDTDDDWLCLSGSWSKFQLYAMNAGYEMGGSELGDHSGKTSLTFTSYKKDSLNLIVTSCDEFYDRFLAATSVAKRFNLLEKSDRVALFQAVLYGNQCDQPTDTRTFEEVFAACL